MVEGYYPQTQEEALKLRKNYPDSLLIMGGTDVMVVRKKAEHVIFLNQVKEWNEVKNENGVLFIGAGAVYSDLLHNDFIPKILKTSIQNIASPAIRSAGTIVGNVCNASPAGDTLPVLYAMDAVIVKASFDTKDGTNIKKVRIPLKEFILGIRKIKLEKDEIVTGIEILEDSYQGFTKAYFEKVGARQSEAISKLSFVGMLKMEEGKVKDVRITFGSVGITVVRNCGIEKEMIGLTSQELNEKRDYFIKAYDNLIHPIDDQRSTAIYRKKVCLNLLEEFLKK